MFIRYMLDYVMLDLNQNILQDLENNKVISDQLIQDKNTEILLQTWVYAKENPFPNKNKHHISLYNIV